MKILVFDDNELHRKAAMNQLGDEHDLVVVGTYNNAEDALTPHVDKGRAKQLRAKAGFSEGPPRPGCGAYDERRDAYREANEEATVYPDFDIVLTDLLVPASSRTLGRDARRYVGEEMSLGTTIAFLAIKNGMKRIGVITDANHHAHPASAALDKLGGCGGEPFNIGDVRVLFASNFIMGPVHPDTGVPLTEQEQEAIRGYDGWKNYPYTKNWQKAVRVLTGELDRDD